MSALAPSYYDLTYTTIKPSWVFYFASFALLMFQTFDGIDGKHARRCKTSSPLGQLFDHGCDSFSVVFLLISISHTVQLEKIYVLKLFGCCQLLIYVVNWSERHLETLTTQVGNFGVTEVQFIVAAIMAITGYYGQAMWHLSIYDLVIVGLRDYIPQQHRDYNLVNFIVGFFFWVILGGALVMFYSTMKKVNDRRQALKDMLPIGVLLLVEVIWTSHVFFDNQLSLIMIVFGCQYSLLCIKLILSTTLKIPHPFHHPELILHLVCALLHLPMLALPPVYLQVFALFVCLSTFLYVVLFILDIVDQLTTILDIECFSVTKQLAANKRLSKHQ